MQNVFITGGAGFLGRAILRRFAEDRPDVSCTIFSRDHGKHARCQKEFPQHRYVIGDIRDYNTVELAMAGHDTVIHAAAFKYVPQGETNVAECHEINVGGSLNVVRAAIRTNVERVIGISTDKACQPINVYGITKLMMERLFQEADQKSQTQFNLVRYGNVVSSTGSAIPIFRQQARTTGEILLTNPSMTRFWLSVYEGVELVKMALAEPMGGTILIPRLPSLSILDIAKASVAIELDGIADNIGFLGPIRYKTVGIRFGEKAHEDLLGSVESQYAEKCFHNISESPKQWFGMTPTLIDGTMRLYPMTRDTIGDYSAPYNSNEPDMRLSPSDAIRMIKEAPE